MTTLLAFVCFIVAAFVFVLNAAFDGGIVPLWGHFFVALGLAFMCLAGTIAAVQNRG